MTIKSMSAGRWVTINGCHVFIGASGKITKGPAKFIGSTVEDLSGSKKSVEQKKSDLKAELKEKNYKKAEEALVKMNQIMDNTSVILLENDLPDLFNE